MITFRRGMMIFVILVIIGIWICLFWFWKSYGDSVKRDPCSVCAEKMGDVVCSAAGVVRTYYQNGTIKDENIISRPIKQINLSGLDKFLPDS